MMGSGGLSNLMPMIDNLLKLYIIFNHSQRRPFIIDAKFNYVLHAEQPNNDLTSFHGYIAHFDGDDKKNVPVKMKNLLLRGCVLRNTDFVIGLVVYAGNETKESGELLILTLFNELEYDKVQSTAKSSAAISSEDFRY